MSSPLKESQMRVEVAVGQPDSAYYLALKNLGDQMATIVVGNKVRLKSGSPELTVCQVHLRDPLFGPEDEVAVWWLDDYDRLQVCVYPRAGLTLVLAGLSEEEMEKKGLKFVPYSEIK